jgi:hypothetical protein
MSEFEHIDFAEIVKQEALKIDAGAFEARHEYLINCMKAAIRADRERRDADLLEIIGLIRDIESVFARMDFNPYAENINDLHSRMCLILAKHNQPEGI